MDERKSLYAEVIDEFDRGFDLAAKYDSVTHQYGSETLFQIEMHTVKFVGRHSNTTVTEISEATGKTVSACSQMIRKLRERGILTQTRNPSNNREQLLHLTDYGWAIYLAHDKIESFCMERTYRYLDQFSDEDLKTYIEVQKKLNEAFQEDINTETGLIEV